MNIDQQFIDLNLIRKLVEISDINLFPLYLKEVYKDLIDRAESQKKNGITRIVFYDYMKLPIFISDKLFSALDRDNDGCLNLKEFIDGLYLLYYGNFKQNAKVIFNIYDFDKDGIINKEDIKILFSYLPLKNEEKQIESLYEIDNILSLVKFDQNFNFNRFIETIEKVKSDIYLQILCFLYEHKPYVIENVEACKCLPKYKEILQSMNTGISIEELVIGSPAIKPLQSIFDYENVNLSSPSKTTIFKPVDSILKMMQVDEFYLDDDEIKVTLPILPKGNTNQKFTTDELNSNQYNMIRMPNQREFKDDNEEVFATPTKFLKKPTLLMSNMMDVDQLDLNNNEEGVSSNMNITAYPRKQSGYIIKQKEVVRKGGIIFKITESKNLRSYYLLLCNKDIYYYKNEKCMELLGMHNLSGSFIMDPTPEKLNIEGKDYFYFSIRFSNKTRIYYTSSFEESQQWVITLKLAIGYQSFNDIYEMQNEVLGEGKFGLVKLGIHRKTGEKVAIKIIKKQSMAVKDFELVRSEIDIMKMCRHPNIVRLLDHFENNEIIFICMEYLAGGTLANYLEHTPVDALTEGDAGVITYQVAKGLEYLHQFGIIHRDLKPENIIIKGKLPYEGLDALKIMDFGLSKILGPNEKVNDGYGTLTYVAPEVLTRKPYNKHVDIWSLGVIVFYTLSGTFPFDDPSNDEEIIAKKTVFSDLKFNHKSWQIRTTSSKDFILKTMTKDLEKRVKIGDIMRHQWFVDCGIIPGKKQGNIVPGSIFK